MLFFGQLKVVTQQGAFFWKQKMCVIYCLLKGLYCVFCGQEFGGGFKYGVYFGLTVCIVLYGREFICPPVLDPTLV